MTPKVYAIADREALGLDLLPDAVRAMADAGVRWIQIRAKNTSGETLFRLVEACLIKIAGSEARLWLDDRVDIAALLPVYGVHVGQSDLPPHAARAVLGPGRRIGFSTHGAAEMAAARDDRAIDVLAVGPIYSTRSKKNAGPALGPDGLRALRLLCDKPLVAIGGIDAERLPEVLAAGADSAAILGAACLPHPDMKRGTITAQDISKIHDGCARLVRIGEEWSRR